MAKMTIKGVDEYALKLSKLGASSEQVAGCAIHSAAGLVADQIRRNLEGIPAITDLENIRAYQSGNRSNLTIAQKRGLLASLGVTRMRQDQGGFYNVKIGFDGYNTIRTRKYPKGQPNQLIARVVESGSSYMDKSPFVRPAVNATRKDAVNSMQQVIDEEFKKIME